MFKALWNRTYCFGNPLLSNSNRLRCSHKRQNSSSYPYIARKHANKTHNRLISANIFESTCDRKSPCDRLMFTDHVRCYTVSPKQIVDSSPASWQPYLRLIRLDRPIGNNEICNVSCELKQKRQNSLLEIRC